MRLTDKYHGGVPTDRHRPWRVPPEMFHAARVTRAKMMGEWDLGGGGGGGGTGPPTGIAGVNSFNPTTSMYNAKSSNLQALRAALASGVSASGIARIAAIGDSTTAGSLAPQPATGSYPSHLTALLKASGYTVGEGAVVASQLTPTPDSRWTISGSWFSTFSEGSTWYTATNGATDTFVSLQSGTVVTIYYWDQNGAWSYNIDGAGDVVVTPTGSGTVRKVTVTGLANSTHTVVIKGTAVSGAMANMFACSVSPAAGIEISNFGAPGASAGTYASLGGGNNWLAAATEYMASNIGPVAFAIVDFGLNDANSSVGVPAYITNMGTVITSIQATSAAVMLMVPMTPANSSSEASLFIPTATWNQYRQAMYTLADTYNLPLLDMTDLAGPFAITQPQGLMVTGDGFHPNSAGYLLMAQALFNGIIAA